MNIALPPSVDIHEVVLRDGIQNEKEIVSTDLKLKIIDRLTSCGVKRIEVSSFVNPRLVPQMADAEELWDRIERKEGVTYSALILSEAGLDRAIRCRVPHVGIFVSASETHSMKNSNKPVYKAKEEAMLLVRKAKSEGMGVRAGVMNVFGCAYEGAIQAKKVMELACAFAACDPDEICLADSSGMANPRQVKELLDLAQRSVKQEISLHLHNTRGRGLANLYAALESGIRIFDTSLGGLGGCPFIAGAKGNIATEDTVSMLHAMNIETGIDLDRVIQISLEFESLMHQSFPAMVTHLCEK
ncbi:MAG: hydroxymethylglutaryl-CoA lyase [Syntrophales bacterium]